jgi:hypothetical protein
MKKNLIDLTKKKEWHISNFVCGCCMILNSYDKISISFPQNCTQFKNSTHKRILFLHILHCTVYFLYTAYLVSSCVEDPDQDPVGFGHREIWSGLLVTNYTTCITYLAWAKCFFFYKYVRRTNFRRVRNGCRQFEKSHKGSRYGQKS